MRVRGFALGCACFRATALLGSAAAMLSAAAAAAAENVNAASLARVTSDVTYLASDELEGRGLETAGLRKAMEYIQAEFQRLGLKGPGEDGSHLQLFSVALRQEVVKERAKLALRGPQGQEISLELGKDYQPLAVGGAGAARGEVVFAGYGVSSEKHKYNDYAGLDAAGKVVLVIRREPQQGDAQSVFEGKQQTSHSYIRTKLQVAKTNKAAAVLLVNDPFTTAQEKQDALAAPAGFGESPMKLPFAHVSQRVVNQMLESAPLKTPAGELKTLADVEKHIDAALTPVSQPLAGWSAELASEFVQVDGQFANVLGVLEGEGPLAHETIVIGAHYDHLGMGEFGSRKPGVGAIHNGADDNASGTAALLEIARRFAQRPTKPARRLLFIAFSAEERGLLGSLHYTRDPLIPLKDTVAMVNFDMVGHLQNDKLTVYGVKTEKSWESLIDGANEDGRLKLDKVGGVIGASDHYSFFQKKIPSLHLFTGLTKEYHTPEDDTNTLYLEGVVRVVDYSETLLDKIIARPGRPEFVETKSLSGGRPMMAHLGVIPDYSGGGGEGLPITGVGKDSPAEKGGLKEGDVIIMIGEVPVGDIQGLADGLSRYKPGTTVDITLRRGEKQITLKVTLGESKRPM